MERHRLLPFGAIGAAVAVVVFVATFAPQVAVSRSGDAGGHAVVAMVDSGADLAHGAISDLLWVNRGETAGNGLDDDGNGIVDDVHGADFVTGDGDPSDEHGHGTHVAGVFAQTAAGNGAQLMVLRALDSGNGGDPGAVAAAVDYAVAAGADVINLSVNTDDDDQRLHDALHLALQAGVLVVTSAGNEGRNLDEQPSFPACEPHAGVVTVAATTADGAVASFSNVGSCVDTTAPGEGIEAAALGGTTTADGTSQAAAAVAGEAAALIAERPGIDARALADALR